MTEHILKGEFKTRRVWVDDKLLDNERVLRVQYALDRPRHSPDGFNWGYSGSGPAQLAFAVLLEVAPWDIEQYQKLKEKLIARLPFQRDFEVKFSWPLPSREQIINQILGV